VAQLQTDASRQEQESGQRAEVQVQRTEELERGLRELTGALEHLRGESRLLSGIMEQLRGEGHLLGSRLSDLAEELRTRIQGAAERLSQELDQRVEQQKGWNQEQAGRIDLVGGRIDEVLGQQLPAIAAELRGRLVTLAQRVDPILPLDYVGFERRFRGEESMIRDRMRKYAGLYGNVRRVLDVGCGRGEFLEICREQGIGAYGVDADSDMVSCCGLKGLEVVHDDLLHHLEALSDRCLDGIFSAQVIEHLSPADLIRFLELASAKLRRGAMLVLETINTDTFTALRTFFVDMTHKRPIPSRSLQFLVEAADFSVQQVIFSSPIPDEVKMRPLPPPPTKGGNAQIATMLQLYNENCDRLNDLLFGPQDYAIVAQR
jgi:O-antigen chain-terminating methyltransferase